MSTRSAKKSQGDSPPSGSSAEKQSINKHQLTTYKARRERSRSPIRTTSEAPSTLSQITQNIKTSGGKEHIKDYQGVTVPHSAEELSIASKILNSISTTDIPIAATSSPTIMENTDPANRKIMCRSMIIEYLGTRGCTTSEGAIEGMVRYHTDTVNDTTGNPVVIKRELLDFYAEGWKDCSVQLSLLNLQTLTTKLDPILGNLTNLSILLKDNEIASLLREIRDGVKKGKAVVPPAPKLPTVSQSLGTISQDEPTPEKTDIAMSDTKSKLSALNISESVTDSYRQGWGGLNNQERFKIIDWLGREVLQIYKLSDWDKKDAISGFAKRMKGSRMMQLAMMHHEGVSISDIKMYAEHLYKNHGAVVIPASGIVIK